MAYVQSGDFTKAKGSLQRALSLRPNFEGADEARKALLIAGG
jgi:Tfp pilus assembly protein PilF